MLVLYHGNIYTQFKPLSKVSALAIHDGKIFAAGSEADLLPLARQAQDKFDLNGMTVWPGLIDAHLHLEHYARALQMVDCETSTKAECLARVAEKARSLPKGAWILGHGWNENVWPEGFGSAADLDAISSQHPIYLTAKSLHAAWANTLAMQLAGIQPDSPDPEGGEFQRDKNGNLTGVLLESAMEVVGSARPPLTTRELTVLLEQAFPSLWQQGITGVHDFDQRSCFIALQELRLAGRLKLRVNKSIPVELLDAAAEAGLRSGFGDDYLWIGSTKLFADGALGPQTAAMLKPYEGSASTGTLLLDREQVFEIGQRAACAGVGLAIHAIGDRANHEVLAGLEQLRAFETERNLPHRRHRIEHVQILHPQDTSALARLNVIASVQPIHATSDMEIADRHWGERSAGAYAFRTLLTSGTAMAFGSDAPVESPNPFWGLHAAVTRRRHDGAPGESGWYPEQRLELSEAVRAYTCGAAYAAGKESIQGRLMPGYLADLILLDQDPFTLDPQELYRIKPRATMVGGEWVYQS